MQDAAVWVGAGRIRSGTGRPPPPRAAAAGGKTCRALKLLPSPQSLPPPLPPPPPPQCQHHTRTATHTHTHPPQTAPSHHPKPTPHCITPHHIHKLLHTTTAPTTNTPNTLATLHTSVWKNPFPLCISVVACTAAAEPPPPPVPAPPVANRRSISVSAPEPRLGQFVPGQCMASWGLQGRQWGPRLQRVAARSPAAAGLHPVRPGGRGSGSCVWRRRR